MLTGKKWIFAKTDPDNPRHYTLRKGWEDPWFTFDEIVMFIRDNGIEEKHKNNWYSVLNLDGFEYWIKTCLVQVPLRNLWHPLKGVYPVKDCPSEKSSHKTFLISRKKFR